MRTKHVRQRKKKVPKGTRERLLEVATQQFAKFGFNGVSTADICELANANVAAITYHFKTKDLLYQIGRAHV